MEAAANLFAAAMGLPAFVFPVIFKLEAAEGGGFDLSQIAQLGLGYVVVMLILVPLMRWWMSSMSKQISDRDEMLNRMVTSLEKATNLLDDSVQQFSESNRRADLVHAEIVASLNRVERKLEPK